jgi:hypothetical protein
MWELTTRSGYLQGFFRVSGTGRLPARQVVPLTGPEGPVLDGAAMSGGAITALPPFRVEPPVGLAELRLSGYGNRVLAEAAAGSAHISRRLS